jgi:hypothetical protein
MDGSLLPESSRYQSDRELPDSLGFALWLATQHLLRKRNGSTIAPFDTLLGLCVACPSPRLPTSMFAIFSLIDRATVHHSIA